MIGTSMNIITVFILLLAIDWMASVLLDSVPWSKKYIEPVWKRLDEQFNLTHGFTQIWIAFDQLLNVILCNPFSKETWADETISSRCGRMHHRWPYKFWRWFIDLFLFSWWQGPDHCVKAYEKEKTRYHCPPEMRSLPATETKLSHESK